MVYALLGTVLGVLAALISLIMGAPLLTAFLVYVGTGTLCLLGGLALAAVCLWRNPDNRRAISPVTNYGDLAMPMGAVAIRHD